MLSTARKPTFWQDVPSLFLAWLVPSTLLLLFTTVQMPQINSAETAGILGLARLDDLVNAPAQAEIFVYFVWPLVLLGALIAGLAFCSSHLMDKGGTLISLVYCTVSLSILPYFAPGHGATEALHLVGLVGLLSFCLASRFSAKSAIGTGLCAAVLLGFSLENAPFVILAFAWTMAGWILVPGEQGNTESRKLNYLGYSFVSGTIVLGMIEGPSWTVLSTGCGPFSLAHYVPAALGGLGMIHLASTTADFVTARQRLYGAGFLALIGVCGYLVANPACLQSSASQINGSVAVLSPELGFLDLLMKAPATAYALAATPIIGLSAATFAALRDARRQKQWILLVASLLCTILLTIFDTGYSIFAHTLAILPCAWMTCTVGHKIRQRPVTLGSVAVFLSVLLAGMSLTHSLMASQVSAAVSANPLPAPQTVTHQIYKQ